MGGRLLSAPERLVNQRHQGLLLRGSPAAVPVNQSLRTALIEVVDPVKHCGQVPPQGLAQSRSAGAAGDVAQGQQSLASTRVRSVQAQLGKGFFVERPAVQLGAQQSRAEQSR